MLLNFQRQFAHDVLQGLKRQTIRAAGRHVPKVGDTAYCYTGLRTVSTIKLGEWPIWKVQAIVFNLTPEGQMVDVVVGGKPLRSIFQLAELAIADGFESYWQMREFFCSKHPPGDFEGWVVSWTWKRQRGVVLPFARGAV